MTRVLYWNVQQFGINKINEPTRHVDAAGNVIPNPKSTYRRAVMQSVLTQNTPDIFVVVETNTGGGNPGTLVNASGSTGSRYLLQRLRAWTANPNWMLIPPLRLGIGGVQEGISVYYDSTHLEFSGPWGWRGAALSSAVIPAGGAGLVNYAGDWAATLPAGNVTGGPNAGRAIRSLAGQWQFTGAPAAAGAAGAVLGFPGANNRTPFLTTFWDTANNRTIKLLSYHAPPSAGPAANGTDSLRQIQEMTTNLVANEVGVIVGDFNTDIFNTHFEPIAYDNLTATVAAGGAGYTRHINPTANQWPDKGYVATMLKQVNTASPWNTNGYPGYGYAITKSYVSVDNILTRYGGGTAVAPAANNLTIVNPVTGSPYNLQAAGPAGALAYNTSMEVPAGGGDPVALPLPPNGPGGNGGVAPGNIGAFRKFNGWANYQRVRSTSDHLPIIMDV